MTALLTYDDIASKLNWPDAVDALRLGHQRPKAEIADLFLGPSNATLLNRAAYIDGLGYGVKAVTVMDGNAAKGLPTVQGAMMVYAQDTGALHAIIESRLVTEYKTAADSVWGASFLARKDSRHLLIIGAGTVAASLVQAYSAIFPGLEQISIWARRPEQAEALINGLTNIAAKLSVALDLQSAVAEADIISSATMAREPILFGNWIRPGTHIDLIGAFKADMREADDILMSRGSVFVDSRETTVHHIGELMMPLAAGVISEADILGDFYDLVRAEDSPRKSPDEITVFKNGGGAHLDLMIAAYIAKAAGK